MNQWTERVCVAALEETETVGERNHYLQSLSAPVSKSLRRLRGQPF